MSAILKGLRSVPLHQADPNATPQLIEYDGETYSLLGVGNRITILSYLWGDEGDSTIIVNLGNGRFGAYRKVARPPHVEARNVEAWE